MTDLAERLEALQARNEEPLPGPNVPYTDDEAKAAFLDLLSRGNTLSQAGAKAQRTVSWFRMRRKPGSYNYDREFSEAFEEIMAPDGAHIEGLVQNARAALIAAAEKGNVRAIEKILAAYDADFHFLRPQAAIGDLNIERFQVLLPQIPTELLLQMKEALQRGQQPELPVIDAGE